MIERCWHCGSWGEECSSPQPVRGCGCARCARATVQQLREALERLAVATDELSWHGEQVRCVLCGQTGTVPGKKRGVGYEPVRHAAECPLWVPG